MSDGMIHTSHDSIPDFAANPTIVSVADGAWSDPATWNLARVPDAADVVNIAHAVNLDEAEADVIGVTGTLRFEDGATLTVTTLLSNGGILDLGRACEIIIRDRPLDTTNDGVGTFDPFQFGHGILCIGGVFRASGEVKTPFVRFGDAPESWTFGDIVVAPDVRQDNNGFEQCEEMFYGLEWLHDHTGGHIANLTRSVVIRSQNSLGTRGHVMCFGNCAVDLRYVQFKDLGRTTAARLHVTIQAPVTPPVYNIGQNQIGRYSLHLHHLEPPMSDGPLWNVEGCVFDRFLRWALAVHDTHYGQVKGCIAFNGVGAGFIQEDGSETGNVWDGNLVILLRGSGDSPVSSNPVRNDQIDTGHEGSGFWNRAQRGTWINNAAANCRWAGYNVFSRRSHVGKPLPVNVPLKKGDPTRIAFDARQSVPVNWDNNEAYACGRGFEWWYAWVTITTNSRVWHCSGKSLFLTYHGTALMGDLTITGSAEGIKGQHGTHLQLRHASIDGATVPFVVEPNKKGILFDDVQIDGVDQQSPPHANLSLILDPAPDSVVSGIVTLKVIGPTAGKVQINVNGKRLVIDYTAPYEAKWDTTKYPNGTAWITVEHGDAVAFGMGRYFVSN